MSSTVPGPRRNESEPRPWLRPLLMAAAVVVLLAVFMAYLNPHLAVDLAGRLWACF